jgi:hypothetical protein
MGSREKTGPRHFKWFVVQQLFLIPTISRDALFTRRRQNKQPRHSPIAAHYVPAAFAFFTSWFR